MGRIRSESSDHWSRYDLNVIWKSNESKFSNCSAAKERLHTTGQRSVDFWRIPSNVWSLGLALMLQNTRIAQIAQIEALFWPALIGRSPKDRNSLCVRRVSHLHGFWQEGQYSLMRSSPILPANCTNSSFHSAISQSCFGRASGRRLSSFRNITWCCSMQNGI